MENKKTSDLKRDELKLLVWGFIFSLGLFHFISVNLNQPELAKNIFYVYTISATLIILGILFRKK